MCIFTCSEFCWTIMLDFSLGSSSSWLELGCILLFFRSSDIVFRFKIIIYFYLYNNNMMMILFLMFLCPFKIFEILGGKIFCVLKWNRQFKNVTDHHVREGRLSIAMLLMTWQVSSEWLSNTHFLSDNILLMKPYYTVYYTCTIVRSHPRHPSILCRCHNHKLDYSEL